MFERFNLFSKQEEEKPRDNPLKNIIQDPKYEVAEEKKEPIHFELPETIACAMHAGDEHAARRDITKILTKLHPNQIFHSEKFELQPRGDIKTYHSEKGGWSRQEIFDVSYEGAPVENCVLILEQGADDDTFHPVNPGWYIDVDRSDYQEK